MIQQPERINAWLHDQGAGRAWPGSFEAIGVERDGKLVAGLVVAECNGVNANISIAIQDKLATRRLLRLGLLYCFKQLKLHRLTFIISSGNLPSIEIAKAGGATHEATLREAGKEREDLHIYALFRESCPLWRKLNGQECGRSPGAD